MNGMLFIAYSDNPFLFINIYLLTFFRTSLFWNYLYKKPQSSINLYRFVVRNVGMKLLFLSY